MNVFGRLLVVSRPRFWPYLAGPVLVGLVYGVESIGSLTSPIAIGLVAYFLVPANVYLYGVNDVFDAEIDRGNPKKRGREHRFRGDQTILAAIIVSAGLGLGLVAIMPPSALPWFAGFFVLGALYSAPPVRFKARPVLDSVSNGLYILPGVGAYVAVAGELPPLAIVAGAWLWTMGMHTLSAIPDIAPDRMAGIRTTATQLGEVRTLGYCAACWTMAALAFGVVEPLGGLLLAIYPMLVVTIALADVAIDRAYWWFPAINTAVGMLITVYGLWGLTHG